jgi:hypothetical protein
MAYQNPNEESSSRLSYCMRVLTNKTPDMYNHYSVISSFACYDNDCKIEDEFMQGDENFLHDLCEEIRKCVKELNPLLGIEEVNFYTEPLLIEITKMFHFNHSFYKKMEHFKSQLPSEQSKFFQNKYLSGFISKFSIDMNLDHINKFYDMIENIKKTDMVLNPHKIYNENIAEFYWKQYILCFNFSSGEIPNITFTKKE